MEGPLNNILVPIRLRELGTIANIVSSEAQRGVSQLYNLGHSEEEVQRAKTEQALTLPGCTRTSSTSWQK